MAAGNKKRRKQTRQKLTPDSAASIWQQRKQDALDTWREAVSAWGETTAWGSKGRMRSGNIELIAGFIEDFLEGLPELLHSPNSIPPDVLVDVVREVLRGLIGILRLQHANLQPRPKHRPKGNWGRWRDPNYVAAALADGRINAWKRNAGERRTSDKETRVGDIETTEIPAEERKPIVKWAVDLVNGWHIANRKKASIQRVTALLGTTKRRRLPPAIVIA
jgi:hypothetical protein